MSYIVSEISEISEIKELKEDWSALHILSRNPSIYNSFEFVFTSIESFYDSSTNPHIILIHKNNNLIGIFFNEEDIESYFGLKLKVIQNTAQQEIDKPYPVIHHEFTNEAWQQYFIFLNKHKKWDLHRSYEIPMKFKNQILSNIQTDNYIVRLNKDKEGPIINLDQDWVSYKSNHKKLRKKINLANKKFNNEVRFETFTDSETALETYKLIEKKSWKKGKIGLCKNREHEDFYHNLQKNISTSEHHSMIIGILSINGIPISGEIAYTSLNDVYFCHGCYDQAYSELSPGMISTAYFIQYFMDGNYIKGDFLCGYSSYLNAWSDDIIETITIDIYRKTASVKLFFLLRGIKKIFTILRIKNVT